jgi:hypothetical protein
MSAESDLESVRSVLILTWPAAPLVRVELGSRFPVMALSPSCFSGEPDAPGSSRYLKRIG